MRAFGNVCSDFYMEKADSYRVYSWLVLCWTVSNFLTQSP